MVFNKLLNVRIVFVAVFSSALTVVVLTIVPFLLSTHLRSSSSTSSATNSRASLVRELFPFSATLQTIKSVGLRPGEVNATIITRTTTNKKCDFPFVYNKAPKCASSFIHSVINKWSKEQGRNNYKCGLGPSKSNLILEECLPRKVRDHCGILNCHIFLNKQTKKVVSERLPNHRLMTSTRYPPHRIVSFYLFVRGFTVDTITSNPPRHFLLLRNYLRQYNPWRLYNYHTGEYRTGTCPLSDGERILITSLAQQYHIVIDANLRNVSNEILGHYNLFQLPLLQQGEKRNKEGGAYRMQLTGEVKEALQNVSCVESALHQALQVRMASAYQEATGIPCVFETSNCIEQMEKDALASNWVF